MVKALGRTEEGNRPVRSLSFRADAPCPYAFKTLRRRTELSPAWKAGHYALELGVRRAANRLYLLLIRYGLPFIMSHTLLRITADIFGLNHLLRYITKGLIGIIAFLVYETVMTALAIPCKAALI